MGYANTSDIRSQHKAVDLFSDDNAVLDKAVSKRQTGSTSGNSGRVTGIDKVNQSRGVSSSDSLGDVGNLLTGGDSSSFGLSDNLNRAMDGLFEDYKDNAKEKVVDQIQGLNNSTYSDLENKLKLNLQDSLAIKCDPTQDPDSRIDNALGSAYKDGLSNCSYEDILKGIVDTNGVGKSALKVGDEVTYILDKDKQSAEVATGHLKKLLENKVRGEDEANVEDSAVNVGLAESIIKSAAVAGAPVLAEKTLGVLTEKERNKAATNSLEPASKAGSLGTTKVLVDTVGVERAKAVAPNTPKNLIQNMKSEGNGEDDGLEDGNRQSQELIEFLNMWDADWFLVEDSNGNKHMDLSMTEGASPTAKNALLMDDNFHVLVLVSETPLAKRTSTDNVVKGDLPTYVR